MNFYKLENLYKTCKDCGNKKKKSEFPINCDLFLYTESFSNDEIVKFFTTISECFSYECLNEKMKEKNIKIEEKTALYKVIFQ